MIVDRCCFICSNMARNFEFIKDITDRKDLFKIAVKVKDKWNVSKEGKEHFEMVVVDSKGDDIFIVVPNDLKNKFDKETPIVEKQTYTMQNFHVSKNAEKFKASHHEFMLKFNGGTRVNDVNKHEIPDTLKFKEFSEILAGNIREDYLYDIIGAVDEIGYTQPHPGSKKIQVNLKLKDLSDNVLHCTLWEDYATKFLNFTNTNSEVGPTILCMKYAKVKKEGKFPLTISNTWSTTRLFINDGLPEISDFKKRFAGAIEKGIISAVCDTQSQRMSQSYGASQYTTGSQYSPEQKFFHAAEVMPLNKMWELTQETKVCTVVNTVKVKSNKSGWYYLGCFQCPKQAFGDAPPYKCGDNHLTETEIIRYKLDVEVENLNVKASFVFWDRECAQILNQKAEHLRAKMIKDGINDPLDYPQDLDDIGGKTLAVKVKWQPNWKSGSVMAVIEDETFISNLQTQFPPEEAAVSKSSNLFIKVNEPLLEDEVLQDINEVEQEDSAEDVIIPEISLSATDEIDPENLQFKTPQKNVIKKGMRTKSVGRKVRPKVDKDDDHVGAKGSSTKIMKIEKLE
ncbi:replication protein A 70 kDa DNA-binding subunit B [Trifolium repens]|nr:replication protein A 70 kDa DNA-binding subunit B [Trifolium repens]